MATLLWPSMVCTVLRDFPSSSINVANVWRASCRRIDGKPACFSTRYQRPSFHLLIEPLLLLRFLGIAPCLLHEKGTAPLQTLSQSARLEQWACLPCSIQHGRACRKSHELQQIGVIGTTGGKGRLICLYSQGVLGRVACTLAAIAPWNPYCALLFSWFLWFVHVWSVHCPRWRVCTRQRT
jgi:hypothetical protein